MSVGKGHPAGAEESESDATTLLLFYGAVGVLAALLFAMSLSTMGSRLAADASPPAFVRVAAGPVGSPVMRPVPEAPLPAAAVTPPALPYRYAGSWTEGRQRAVMLKSGERFVVVRGAGPVDTNYSVQSIGRDRILLKYLPSSAVVALGFGSSAHATELRPPLPDVVAVQQPKTDLVDN